MTVAIEGCSYDERTHAIAGDCEGLLALSDAMELATERDSLQVVPLQKSNDSGFRQEDLRLENILVQKHASGALCFKVRGAELLIEGGPWALAALCKSLRALAKQERKPGMSSPRFVPRWFEGNDLLQKDSDELSFHRLPIEPALRLS